MRGLQQYLFNSPQQKIIKFGMSCQTKPVHQYFNHKLATIDSSTPQPTYFDPLTSSHKIRHHSLVFHQQQHQDHITHQNQKLLSRLLQISKRKSSEYATIKNAPKIVSFNNPARKKREKMITEMNLKMAQRLLGRESYLDRKSMRKSMEQYQTIKRTMNNNRRHLYLSSQFNEGLSSLSQSQVSKKRKIKLQMQQGNPEGL